jgi:hypothetical protein
VNLVKREERAKWELDRREIEGNRRVMREKRKVERMKG